MDVVEDVLASSSPKVGRGINNCRVSKSARPHSRVFYDGTLFLAWRHQDDNGTSRDRGTSCNSCPTARTCCIMSLSNAHVRGLEVSS